MHHVDDHFTLLAQVLISPCNLNMYTRVGPLVDRAFCSTCLASGRANPHFPQARSYYSAYRLYGLCCVLCRQVLQEGSGNGTRNSTSLLDVGEEQPSPDDSMDPTPPPEEGQGGGAGDTGASELAPDVRADDDAMPETKSPTRRPTQSARWAPFASNGSLNNDL